jgi:hypothetical protein
MRFYRYRGRRVVVHEIRWRYTGLYGARQLKIITTRPDKYNLQRSYVKCDQRCCSCSLESQMSTTEADTTSDIRTCAV